MFLIKKSQLKDQYLRLSSVSCLAALLPNVLQRVSEDDLSLILKARQNHSTIKSHFYVSVIHKMK